jgi:hypothetical protein
MLGRRQLDEVARLIARSQDILAELRTGPASEARQKDLLFDLRPTQERILAICRGNRDAELAARFSSPRFSSAPPRAYMDNSDG